MRASVIGAGPNGLSAAIVLAASGLDVDAYEAEPGAGGAVRTLELTLPGFRHDFGSAVHPLAAGSPFFSSLPLAAHGLEWIHGDAPLAHPLDDGSAVVLEREARAAEHALGADGGRWRQLTGPLADNWEEFARDALGPPLRWPRSPLRMARFGLQGLLSAEAIAERFAEPRTRALWAGLAGHSFLRLDAPLSAAIGLVLGAAAHAPGWPVPRGGAGVITHALQAHLESLGGRVHTSRRIESLDEVDAGRGLILCDTTPRRLAELAGERVPASFLRTAELFRPGPGSFKVDYALSEAVPWRAVDCRRAITVHLGGGYEEIAEAEDQVAGGRHAPRPFVLLAQPSLFDPTRAPRSLHTLWAYCHVPHGSRVDMTERIEAQIERFAPGFRDCVLERRSSGPAELEARDANLVGGDISGGAMDLGQVLLRPGWRTYATGSRNLYLCSSSTPPGGGVHGMCGYHAARAALGRLRGS